MAEPSVPPGSRDDDPGLTVVCREFVELVTAHMEGALPEQVERAISAHLELCDPCVVYLEQMRSTRASLRSVPTPTLPPAARDRLLEVFSAVHDATRKPSPN